METYGEVKTFFSSTPPNEYAAIRTGTVSTKWKAWQDPQPV